MPWIRSAPYDNRVINEEENAEIAMKTTKEQDTRRFIFSVGEITIEISGQIYICEDPPRIEFETTTISYFLAKCGLTQPASAERFIDIIMSGLPLALGRLRHEKVLIDLNQRAVPMAGPMFALTHATQLLKPRFTLLKLVHD